MTTPIASLTSALADRYRIERELGAGGMATVYLAQDLKHDRKVAIKVLKPELAAVIGAERFVVEIKTTAALQHPHILPLFDSGTTGPFLYYVMPYIEGETLRTKLDREHQLGIEEAVRITTQVADALDYAHRHGVIHRDIKPENILLHDGRPMVADFGIALALSAAAGGRMTETGMSLGTPHYMSPEQATAEKEITGRSDIYSLGSVLYEMLTGNPPHVGATAQQIIMKIIAEPVQPVTAYRKSVPPNVAAAIAKSLEKLPADRFATAADFAKALGDASFHTTEFGPHGTVALRAAQRQSGTRSRAMIGALVGVTALAAWGWFRPAPPTQVMRYGLAFAKGQEPTGGLLLSRDGKTLVYGGPGDSGAGRLWVKEEGRFEGTPLAGTDGAVSYSLSPDGRWIAFVRRGGGAVLKMQISGGPATPLADSAAPAGIAWLDDGTLVYSSMRGHLMRVAASGGPTTPIAPAESEADYRVFPTPLPGSRGLLFTSCGQGNECTPSAIWVVDLGTKTSRMLVPGGLRAWYLPTGTLIYVDHDGHPFAVPFDPKRLELRGTPVPVLSDVALLSGGIPVLSVSDGGTVVMEAGVSSGNRFEAYDLVSIDRSGVMHAVDTTFQFHATLSGGNLGFALSPDGSRLAIGLNTRSGDDIWIKRLPTGAPSRLTFDTTSEQRPRWTSDGRYVSYVVDQGDVWRRRSDGTGSPELVHTPPNVSEMMWSHDGKWLIFRTGGQTTATGTRNIYGMRIGDTTVIPLAADPHYDEEAPALSPDGRWLAYESDETGRTEVYVRPFPDVRGGEWQASVDGGQAPIWSHSGRELYFVDGKRDMIAMPVRPGPNFVPGDRVRLFHLPPEAYLPPHEHYAPFDLTPDDRHFIFMRQQALAVHGERLFLRIENWIPELQQQLKGAK